MRTFCNIWRTMTPICLSVPPSQQLLDALIVDDLLAPGQEQQDGKAVLRHLVVDETIQPPALPEQPRTGRSQAQGIPLDLLQELRRRGEHLRLYRDRDRGVGRQPGGHEEDLDLLPHALDLIAGDTEHI